MVLQALGCSTGLPEQQCPRHSHVWFDLEGLSIIRDQQHTAISGAVKAHSLAGCRELVSRLRRALQGEQACKEVTIMRRQVCQQTYWLAAAATTVVPRDLHLL
jgi:hypothetical protein